MAQNKKGSAAVWDIIGGAIIIKLFGTLIKIIIDKRGAL